MPYRSRYGKPSRRYGRKRKRRAPASRYRKKTKARSKGRATTIQSSTYVPKSKMVRFVETREYVVIDDQIKEGTTQPVCPSLSIPCNNPCLAWQTKRHATANGHQPETSNQDTVAGDWKPASYVSDASVAMPNVSEWVSDNLGGPALEGVTVDGTGTAFYSASRYRHAEVLSAAVTVSALPQPSNTAADPVQDSAVLVLQKSSSRFNHFIGRNQTIDRANNASIIGKMPYTTIGHTYTNLMGNPKGATVKMGYSFKAMNAGHGRAAANFFTLNSEPMEHDSFHIALMPRDPHSYMKVSPGSQRMAPHVVTVKLTYFVKLSEPRPLTRVEANAMLSDDIADAIGENLD